MPKTEALNVKTVIPILKGKTPITGGAGTRLVGDRLRKLGQMGPSQRSKINLAQALLIKQGDRVPSAFLGIPGLKVDRTGRAAASYTDAWCQSNWNQGSDWGSDSWGECWDNSADRVALDRSSLVINTEKTGIKEFALSEFTARELKVLAGVTAIR